MPRYDCAFINSNPDLAGLHGLSVVRIKLFFSFNYQDIVFPCALVHWYSYIDDNPDSNTGMWCVQPEFNSAGEPHISVLHLDCVVRAAHLIGMYGNENLPDSITLHNSLDVFRSYYVNKFIDHHAFEIAS